MVGLFGFEPKTSSMSTKRSNQLSYNPMSDECIIHDMRKYARCFFAISCIWLDRCGIHAAARHLVYMDRSFGGRRRRSYLLHLQDKKLAMPKDDRSIVPARASLRWTRYGSSSNPSIRTPKTNKCFSALIRKLVVRGDISEIRTHYTSEYPALQDPVRAGYSYNCSLVGLSGFEPETSSM